MSEQQNQASAQTQKKDDLFRLLVRVNRWQLRVGAVVIILAVGVGTWLVTNTTSIPGKYRQGLSFPLYYPSYLPQGYSVNTTSFTRQSNVLIFTIHTPSNKDAIVSEEKIPSGLDLSTSQNQSGQNLPDEATFTTVVGSAQIDFWGSKYVSSLVTPNTWIIINISGLTKEQGKLVTQSFRQI